MDESITYVGMDTSLPNEARAVRRMVKNVQRTAPGGGGVLLRGGTLRLRTAATDRRSGFTLQGGGSVLDSRQARGTNQDRPSGWAELAELEKAGLLTEVRPPTSAVPASYGQVGAAEGTCLCGRGGAWTQGHYGRLRSLEWEHAAERAVFDDYMLAIEQIDERLKTLEAKLEELAQQEPYREKVGWLMCFRGIKTITAMTILTELHGFERFSFARGLMAYLGLVPSEHSSGGSVRRGKITGAGNVHARRVLIEAAQDYRLRPSVRAAVVKRRKGQPAWVIAIADRAQQRLHRRMWRLLGRGKPHNKVVVAVARELAGFIWAVMQGPSVGGQEAA